VSTPKILKIPEIIFEFMGELERFPLDWKKSGVWGVWDVCVCGVSPKFSNIFRNLTPQSPISPHNETPKTSKGYQTPEISVLPP
jgi:hypothetical protein